MTSVRALVLRSGRCLGRSSRERIRTRPGNVRVLLVAPKGCKTRRFDERPLLIAGELLERSELCGGVGLRVELRDAERRQCDDHGFLGTSVNKVAR